MKIKTQQVALSKLHLNTGQIPGVPKNPRYIKDERFEALKKSIQDDPEMLELREIIAYDNNGELVIVGGNMRYRAMKELGFKDAPVKVLPQETAAEKIRAFIVKDNVAFGSNDWDILGNEWEVDELIDFGLECDLLMKFQKRILRRRKPKCWFALNVAIKTLLFTLRKSKWIMSKQVH